MREMLVIWPLFTIVVWECGHEKWGVVTVHIAAILEHNDRVYM